MKYAYLMALTLFLAGCATTHPGNEGISLSKDVHLPLKVSAQTIDNPKDESFQLIEITVENMSDEWLRINHSEVIIPDPATSKLSLVFGKDLTDWAQAMEFRLAKDNHNKELLQASLLGAGAVAAIAGEATDNKGLAAAGVITVTGTYAWAATDVILQSRKSAEQSQKVPENHLYRPFSVPGKMFLRRWVLLNKPTKTVVQNLVVQLENVAGEKETYEIKL